MGENSFVKVITVIITVGLVLSIVCFIYYFNKNATKIKEEVVSIQEDYFTSSYESEIFETDSTYDYAGQVEKSLEEKQKTEDVIEQYNINNQQFMETIGLSQSEFDAANDILIKCNIIDFDNTVYDETEGNIRRYEIDSITYGLPEIFIYFNENNELTAVKYGDSVLYENGEFFHTIDEYRLSEDERLYCISKIFEKFTDDGATDVDFSYEDGGAKYLILDPDTRDVNVFGVVKYTDENGNIVKKSFESNFVGGKLTIILIEDFEE